MELSNFTEVFFEEASEHLENMESLLLGVDIQNPEPETLNAIFRSAHSVKGGAATFGFEKLQKTTHIFENILDSLRKGEMALREDTLETFLKTKDVLNVFLDSYRNSSEPDDATYIDICAELNLIAQNEIGAGKETQERIPKESLKFQENSASNRVSVVLKNISEKDRESLLEELAHFGDVESSSGDVKRFEVILTTNDETSDIEAVMLFIVDESQLEVNKIAHVDKEITPETAQSDQFDTSSQKVKTAPGTGSIPSTAKASESSTLRVPVEKVDQIINLVGELVITQSMIDQSVSQLDASTHADLTNGMSLLQRNARDLQEAVMSIRMVQMEFVFSRFPRQIRDLAGKLGKEVEFVTEGKSTELDKSLVERIIDPLSHLVRNSLDHGIEMPDARVAAGKSRKGTLTLSAQHQGGNILIEVKDDGAGLNRDSLLKKARSNGLSAPDSMSDDEVWQLIFAPGFSTAEVVTDVSGRGVGMDVVKRNIQSLGGQVQILSKKGQGTTTRIVLPLTMAILDGMSVKTGNELFILPLGAVIESLQPNQEDVYSMAGTDQLLKVRDEYLPLIVLKNILGIADGRDSVTDCIAVIVSYQNKKFALVVDELIGQQQVVVKNLETNYRKVPGFSAATILGDGSVSLILDVAEIYNLSKE